MCTVLSFCFEFYFMFLLKKINSYIRSIILKSWTARHQTQTRTSKNGYIHSPGWTGCVWFSINIRYSREFNYPKNFGTIQTLCVAHILNYIYMWLTLFKTHHWQAEIIGMWEHAKGMLIYFGRIPISQKLKDAT